MNDTEFFVFKPTDWDAQIAKAINQNIDKILGIPPSGTDPFRATVDYPGLPLGVCLGGMALLSPRQRDSFIEHCYEVRENIITSTLTTE